MTDNPAKYFDSILIFLASEYNRMFSFTDVLNELHSDKRKGQNEVDKAFDVPIEPEENDNFLNAIMFLSKEGLIWYNIEEAEICIQTAGFIKIKTKGFEEEISDAKLSLQLEWFNNFFTPIIAILAFILSLLALIF